MTARDPSDLKPRAPAREGPCGNHLLSIGVERYGEAWWISVHGELDLSTAPLLERELLDCEARDDRPITIDLRALTFMDLAGLHLLLDASGRSRKDTNRLSLVRGPRAVQRVIELTGSEPLLPFTDPLAIPPSPSFQAGATAPLTESPRRASASTQSSAGRWATRGQHAPHDPNDLQRARQPQARVPKRPDGL